MTRCEKCWGIYTGKGLARSQTAVGSIFITCMESTCKSLDQPEVNRSFGRPIVAYFFDLADLELVHVVKLVVTCYWLPNYCQFSSAHLPVFRSL